MRSQPSVSAMAGCDNIKQEIYVHQPPGFVDPSIPGLVYKLDKVLYGLHQAPHVWYSTLIEHLLGHF